jgi:hypothetical protein
MLALGTFVKRNFTVHGVSPDNSWVGNKSAHGISEDQAASVSRNLTLNEPLRYIVELTDRSPLDIMAEFWRLSAAHGKLTWSEYVRYRVYEPTHSPAERVEFISNLLHWPVTHACCDMAWQAATEDKWLSYSLLHSAGVSTPKTVAVIDRSLRSYANTIKITTAAELRGFLTSECGSLFGKANRGIASLGSFLVEDFDGEWLVMRGREPLRLETFFDDFVGADPYILQNVVSNHPNISSLSSELATVRLCILVTDAEVRIPFAVLKLPAGKNVADSFWRRGNIACALNVETGRIEKARTRHRLGTTDVEQHPDTGAELIGQSVPLWNDVLTLARCAAPLFSPVRYQSMDIAVTEHGPVLIEINTGGGFDLPQLATGRGFLTPEVREFFKRNGFKRF